MEPWPEGPAHANVPGRRRPPAAVRYVAVALVAAAAGAAGGYTIGDRDPGTDRAVRASDVSPTITPPPSPTPSATAAAAPARSELGQVRRTDAGTITVHAYRDPVKLDSDPDEPATHWAAIEAETCYQRAITDEDGKKLDDVTIAWDFWSVSDAANRRYKAFTSGSTPAFLTPSYPNLEPLSLGECSRGWIMVPVADGAKVTTVRYENDVDPAAVWRVG